jgi:hypothetical protein
MTNDELEKIINNSINTALLTNCHPINVLFSIGTLLENRKSVAEVLYKGALYINSRSHELPFSVSCKLVEELKKNFESFSEEVDSPINELIFAIKNLTDDSMKISISKDNRPYWRIFESHKSYSWQS